jgi:hypothetical protein
MAIAAGTALALALGACGSGRGERAAGPRTGPAAGRAGPAAGGTGPAGGTGLAALVRERRPIGRGPRFQPPATGPVPGRCRRALGPRFGVHVELFAADRVVLVPAGIGTRGPLRRSAGRIAGARCYGALVTLEPTGVILARPGRVLRLATLFRAWGRALSRRSLLSFGAAPGGGVTVYVGGLPWHGAPGGVPLTRHAEIVLEVGPPVPPHSTYTFPPGV